MSILDRVVTNQAITELPPIKWLIEGPAKTGKSTMAASWPKPVFLDMPGERGLQFIEGVQRLPVERWSDIKAICLALREENTEFESVVIDTLDACFALAATEHTNGNLMQIQDYPKVYEMMFRMLEGFTSLGIHVVATSHVKALTKGKGENKEVERYVNNLPKQLCQRVGGSMDQILHTNIHEDGSFRVLCRNTALYEAGGRVQSLPKVLVIPEGEPLFPMILKAFEDGVKGVATSSPKATKPSTTTKPRTKKAQKAATKPDPKPKEAKDQEDPATAVDRVAQIAKAAGFETDELNIYLSWNFGDGTTLEGLTAKQAQDVAAILEEPELAAAQLSSIRGEDPPDNVPEKSSTTDAKTTKADRKAHRIRLMDLAKEAEIKRADLLLACKSLGAKEDLDLVMNSPPEVLEKLEALLTGGEEGIAKLEEHIDSQK